MPYVNIPESQLGGIASAQIGKLQGVVISKVLQKASGLVQKLKEEGCPTSSGTAKLRSELNNIKSLIDGVDNKLSKFKALPSKLQRPVGGLKAALRLILLLPIPQAVPPGIGLPVSITTKYADFLHLLKELIKQADETINSINAALTTPNLSLNTLNRLLSQVDNAIRTCEIQNALNEELLKGTITQSQLEELGLFDGGLITSNLGPRLLSNADDSNFKGIWTPNSRQCYKKNDRVQYKAEGEQEYSISVATEDHCSSNNSYPGRGPWKRLSTSIDETINVLNNSILLLDSSNISQEGKDNLKKVLDTFKSPSDVNKANDNLKDFTYTGINGEVYELDIVVDPTSPNIAPRRYAVAKDSKGVIVMKGGPSFSSDVQVLLDEIKFRIDNQLP
jgi:hypothetical protein